MQLTLRLNVWRRISDALFKIIEAGELEPSLMTIFAGIAPIFLLRMNGTLDLAVDDYMLAKLTEHPIIAPLLMDANNLVGATSNVSSDDQLEEHFESIQTFPPLITLLKALIKHMGDEINLSVTHQHVGVQARITGEGLNDVLKTMCKYMSPGESLLS